jgi:hypothetical protein
MVEPVLDVFLLFPVLTIGYFYGVRWGLGSVALAAVGWFSAVELERESPAAWAFLAAAALIPVPFALRRRAASRRPVAAGFAADADLLAEAEEEDRLVFAANVSRLKRTLLPSALLYGLMGAAFNYPVFANDPISGALYARDLIFPAVLVMLAWGFAYMPMKFTTAATTGCMFTGSFYEAALAMLMPNPVAAFVALAALRVVEVYALLPALRLFERYPEIRELADTMRTAQGRVMEIAFLVAGAIAAASLAGGFGVAVVIAAWWLNSRASAPIMPLAVGPFAALVVGIVVNVFHALGLGA